MGPDEDRRATGAESGRATLIVAAACAAAALLLAGTGTLAPLELALRDATLRLAPHRSPDLVAVVAIDESSLARLGPWPWPRDTLARLVQAMADQGARAVVLDLLLVEASPTDELLAGALTAVPSVLAVGIGEGGWLVPSPRLALSARLGHATFEPDRDGVVRRLPAVKQFGSTSYPALALAALQRVDPSLAVPVGVVLRPDFRLRWAELPVIPAWRMLAHPPARGAVAGRIALLGVTAAGLGDRAVVPTSPGGQPMAGVEVHAGVIQCVARGATLRKVAPLIVALFTGALGAAVWTLARRGGSSTLILLPAAALVAPSLLAAAALWGLGWELPSLVPTTLGVAVTVAAQGRRMATTRRAASRLMATLGEQPGEGEPRQTSEDEMLHRLAVSIAARQAAERDARRVLAHELKTPLTAVRGLTQMLAEYELTPDERQRVASLAAAEALRLQQMVEGLLELERLSTRRREEVATPVHLSRLVTQRVALFRASRARAVTCEVEDGVWVPGDQLLLERVLDNLLANAGEYSPGDRDILVRLTVDGNAAVLAVADRGPGVPPGERARIFGRFVRGAAGAGRPGLGLGLAVVAEVVAWHGGTVEVTDTPGGGATFLVRLPLAGPEKGQT